MAQTVFRANQVNHKQGEVLLKLNKEFLPPPVEEEEEVPEYTGPSADDLRREAETFKMNWESEKAQMITKAQGDAEKNH